jgi:hypothetical protein
METIPVIVWCACSYWAYQIAKGKGRDPVGFAFLGFFLGIIGVLITACVPAKKPTYVSYAEGGAFDAPRKAGEPV